jgi:hypothetical protein
MEKSLTIENSPISETSASTIKVNSSDKVTNNKTSKKKIALIVLVPLFLILFACCGLFIYIIFFTPPTLKLNSTDNSNWNAKGPVETIKLICSATDIITLNETLIVKDDKVSLCGVKGYNVELLDGKNYFNFTANRSGNKEIATLQLVIYFDKKTYEDKLAQEKRLEEERQSIIDAYTPTPTISPKISPSAAITNVTTQIPSPTSIPLPTATAIPTITPTPSYLLDANDYKKKDYSTIINKYGKPESEHKATAPVFSNFYYDKSTYSLESYYLSNDTLVYGSNVELKTATCKYDDGLNIDQRLFALQAVNLTSLKDKSWTYTTSIMVKQFHLVSTDGWSDIYISCSNDNSYRIIFQADGWDLRYSH